MGPWQRTSHPRPNRQLNSQRSCEQHHPTKTNESHGHEIPLVKRQNEPIAIQVPLEARANKPSRLLDKIPHCSTSQELQKGNPNTSQTSRKTFQVRRQSPARVC